jgi:DNA modification methylase
LFSVYLLPLLLETNQREGKQMTEKKQSSYYEIWPIEKPIPYARNPRKISEEAVAGVAGSIKEFGFKQPIVVDSDGVIIIGHTRLKAAQRLGLKEVPVLVASDLTPTQCQALRLTDNRVGEFSEWDSEMLTLEIEDLGGAIDLEFAGFDELMAEIETPKPAVEMNAGDPNAVPELKPEAISQRGEVFELGPHRLMCGDSTSAEDWQTLLGPEIADAVMTDPPYGVNYKGKTADAMEIENDDPEGLPALLDGALGNVLARCKDGGAWYVAAPAGPLSLIFENWLFGKGILRQCIVWVKDSMVLGHSDYHYKHEPIYYGWKPGAPHREPPDRTQVSVWEIPRPKRSKEHPTMKPVELYERMMNNSTSPGEIVLEPFGGSGTTLIAAAKTGRICRAMEIAPRYCDVIRRRWTKFAKENNVEPGSGALE